VADSSDYFEYYHATAREKLRALSDKELDTYQRYFAELLPRTQERSNMWRAADGRLTLLNAEIDRRRADQQHRENLAQGKKTLDISAKTLSWTKVAAAAAIFGVLVGGIALLHQIKTSGDAPSVASPSPGAFPATTETPSELPSSAAITASSTPSPTPESDQTSPP
jgi:hypothetical protein